jgi:hypothetical protein
LANRAPGVQSASGNGPSSVQPRVWRTGCNAIERPNDARLSERRSGADGRVVWLLPVAEEHGHGSDSQ